MMGLESLSQKKNSEGHVPTGRCLSVHTSSLVLFVLGQTKRRLCFTICPWVEAIILVSPERFWASHSG